MANVTFTGGVLNTIFIQYLATNKHISGVFGSGEWHNTSLDNTKRHGRPHGVLQSPYVPHGTEWIKSSKSDRTRKYFATCNTFINWMTLYKLIIGLVHFFLHWIYRVSYNQWSRGPSIPSVHSSFHKYYHNSISAHKYQPGIKWRSHLDYICMKGR